MAEYIERDTFIKTLEKTKKVHIVEVKENSLTAYLFNREFYFKFCPNCGAKMDKEG